MKAVGFIYNECMSNKKVDLVIAGQGAAGYSAALYSARYQVKTMILGSEFGGETAIGGLIENYPGIEVDGFDLMMSMKDQVLKYDVELFEENALKIEQSDDTFNVHTDSCLLYTSPSPRD